MVTANPWLSYSHITCMNKIWPTYATPCNLRSLCEILMCLCPQLQPLKTQFINNLWQHGIGFPLFRNTYSVPAAVLILIELLLLYIHSWVSSLPTTHLISPPQAYGHWPSLELFCALKLFLSCFQVAQRSVSAWWQWSGWKWVSFQTSLLLYHLLIWYGVAFELFKSSCAICCWSFFMIGSPGKCCSKCPL